MSEDTLEILKQAPDALRQWLISQDLNNVNGIAVLGKVIGRMLAEHALNNDQNIERLTSSFVMTLVGTMPLHVEAEKLRKDFP